MRLVLSLACTVLIACIAIGSASSRGASERTGPRSSLTLTPTLVRAGGTVRIRGTAGGCPSGDTVFVLSRAFVAAHSFAGVPAVLARVRRGEIIQVTDRKRAVALLVPTGASEKPDLLRELVRAGRLSWNGGKPAGTRLPPVVRGPSVSDAVVEDRR